MRFSEHDDDRFIRVRVSEWDDWMSKIKDLEEEVAKLTRMAEIAGPTIKALEAEIAKLRKVLGDDRGQNQPE